jgi:UDPglucose 6-dehydrogenase
MANLADEVGADIHKIAKAMGMDGRISPKFLHPGPGYGGSCFPKDTKALVHIGKEVGVDMSLVKEVIRANEMQKLRMVDKAEKLLGNLQNKVIAVWGLAFKAETDDMRESPAIVIINELIKRGAKVKATDPKAIENAKRIFGNKIDYFYDEFDAAKDSDMVMIVTEWNQYRNTDLEKLRKTMKGKVILDTRNVLDPAKVKQYGFVYEGVGRK